MEIPFAETECSRKIREVPGSSTLNQKVVLPWPQPQPGHTAVSHQQPQLGQGTGRGTHTGWPLHGLAMYPSGYTGSQAPCLFISKYVLFFSYFWVLKPLFAL